MSLEGLDREADPSKAIEWFRSAVDSEWARAQFGFGVTTSLLKRSTQRLQGRWEQLIKGQRAAGGPNDAFFLYMTACNYHNGFVTEQQIDKAIEFYRRAAQGGHVEACHALAQLYANGWCVKKDTRESLHWYCMAARCIEQQGQPLSDAQPTSVLDAIDEPDLQQDLAWCREAAQRGNADAQVCLALAYKNGTGVEKSMEQAYHFASQAVQQGHAFGQYLLGMFYRSGFGVEKDEKLGEEWMLKAAQQRCSQAEVELARIWMQTAWEGKRGSQGQQEITETAREAFDMVRRAALTCHAGAKKMVAACYEHGIGISEDKAAGRFWLAEAAKYGDAHAQYRVGALCEKGDGTEVNMRQALDWYRKAAANGNSQAQCALGRLYLNGNGVVRDIPAAFEFFKSAEQRGSRHAAEQLGRLYRSGDLGTPDHKQSMHWLLESRKEPAHTLDQTPVDAKKAPKVLNLSSLELQAAQIRYLPEEIGTEHSWSVLDLSNNAFDDEAAGDIARLIRRDQHLSEIRLSRTRLGAAGLEEIAQAMHNNISLLEVTLDHHVEEAQASQAKRINEERARNARIGELRSRWNKPELEGASATVPTDVVHPLGDALILQDQKFGSTAVTAEATRLRLAMLLLSLKERKVAQPWEQ